jgi:hypothetical protein
VFSSFIRNKRLYEKLKNAGISHITQFYTSEFKYSKKLHHEVSTMLIETLKAQGLWL